jgi:hypothetical protein
LKNCIINNNNNLKIELMKNLTILLVLLCLTLIINAQSTPPTIQWQRCYGGTSTELGKSIFLTQDGGYILAGSSSSVDGDITGHHASTVYGNLNYDFWIVKIDSSGNIQWQKSEGGSDMDYGESIIQTSDLGYIIAGASRSNDGDVTYNHNPLRDDYWIIKLDTSGNLLWDKSLGGSNFDHAYSVQEITNNGCIIAGYAISNDSDVTGNNGYRDYWIVKIDSSRNIHWQKCYGSTSYDDAFSILKTKDGGYIVAGNASANNGNVTGYHGNNATCHDAWVIKLDSSGNLQWQKCFGGSSTDGAYSIQQTFDGGYIFSGYTYSNDGNVSGNHDTTSGTSDFWIVKIDYLGNIQWQKCYGGSDGDQAFSIQQTNDRGYIVAGKTNSNDGDITGFHGIITGSDLYNDIWIVKLDTIGNLQWQKCIGGSHDDQASTIKETNDGGFIVIGNTYSNDGDVTGNHGAADYWAVKLAPPPLEIKTKSMIFSDFSIYPNPANRNFTVNVPTKTKYIELLNSIGQVIEKRIGCHEEKVKFELKDYGFYFVRIVTDKKTITKKVVIQ